MCVIVHKPANKELTSKDIALMLEANPDGFGVTWLYKGFPQVLKGVFEFRQVENAIKKLMKKELLIHFRWKTHGKIEATQAHPFVVHPTNVNKLPSKNDVILMHNGVLSHFGNAQISDTIDFIQRIASRVSRNELPDLLSQVGSKWAILTKDGVELVGHFEKYKGLHVSNSNFLPKIYPVNKKPYKFTYDKGKWDFYDSVFDSKLD